MKVRADVDCDGRVQFYPLSSKQFSRKGLRVSDRLISVEYYVDYCTRLSACTAAIEMCNVFCPCVLGD